jgi:hypothetical protein
MLGVEIRDMHPRGFLAFDLREILRCLGSEATDRVWRCQGLDVTGDAAEELEATEEAGTELSGDALLCLADRTTQVIDGQFLGRLPGEVVPSVRIRAIDSTSWEVYGDELCIDRVRAAFKSVRPAQPDAG